MDHHLYSNPRQVHGIQSSPSVNLPDTCVCSTNVQHPTTGPGRNRPRCEGLHDDWVLDLQWHHSVPPQGGRNGHQSIQMILSLISAAEKC